MKQGKLARRCQPVSEVPSEGEHYLRSPWKREPPGLSSGGSDQDLGTVCVQILQEDREQQGSDGLRDPKISPVADLRLEKYLGWKLMRTGVGQKGKNPPSLSTCHLRQPGHPSPTPGPFSDRVPTKQIDVFCGRALFKGT